MEPVIIDITKHVIFGTIALTVAVAGYFIGKKRQRVQTNKQLEEAK